MGDPGRFGAAADVELGEDARDVDARGLLGHEELRADLAVRGARGDQLEHLALARREAERVVRRRPARRLRLAGDSLEAAAGRAPRARPPRRAARRAQRVGDPARSGGRSPAASRSPAPTSASARGSSMTAPR